MKIAIIRRKFTAFGGAENFILRASSGLSQLGINFFIISELWKRNAHQSKNIQFPDEISSKAKISIFSLSGQIVYTNSNFEEKHFVLNIDNYSKGVYFCRVENDDKVAFSKFVKN